jgi:hypothetical protein
MNAVQSASLNGPSLSSEFPSDLVVPPSGRGQCNLDHVQHTKSGKQSIFTPPEQQKYDTRSRWPAARTPSSPLRCAPTCNAY